MRVNDERQLVQRCLAGQEDACREFVARFEHLVFGVCLRMLGDRHEAEDAAQESFLRALRSLRRWDAVRPLRHWLVAIAANRCRTALSRRRRRPSPVESVAEVPDLRPADGEADELREEIARALLTLRADYREVFLLYHEQGLSYDEMSAALQRPVGTLKTWLHRARAELMALLRRKGLAPDAPELPAEASHGPQDPVAERGKPAGV